MLKICDCLKISKKAKLENLQGYLYSENSKTSP